MKEDGDRSCLRTGSWRCARGMLVIHSAIKQVRPGFDCAHMLIIVCCGTGGTPCSLLVGKVKLVVATSHTPSFSFQRYVC